MNEPKNDLLCPNCGKSKLDHYARNPDGTLLRGDRGQVIYNRCQASRDYRASRYYDDILRLAPDPGPETTPLSGLIHQDKYIRDALIVGDARLVFNPHMKTFIYDFIEIKKVPRFSFLRVEIPDIRNCKFGEGERSFSKWDIHYLLVFNLDVEGYDNKADADHIKELLEHRRNHFLPIWFLTATPSIKNRHVPAEVMKHIQTLPAVQLAGGVMTTAQQVAAVGKKKDAASFLKQAAQAASTSSANDIANKAARMSAKPKVVVEQPVVTTVVEVSADAVDQEAFPGFGIPAGSYAAKAKNRSGKQQWKKDKK